jgi:hypothetical protein
MPIKSREIRFEVNIRGPWQPKTCFPSGMDTSSLKEVSCVGDIWAKFINTRTGEEFDCGEYYRRAILEEGLK